MIVVLILAAVLLVIIGVLYNRLSALEWRYHCTIAQIYALQAALHDLGLVMSNESVTSGVELGDTIENLKDSFGAIGTKLAVDLMPVIQQVADYITAHMPEIQAVIQTVFDVVGSVIEAIKPIITGLISIISDVVTSAQTEGTAFNDIWKGIQAVFESVIAIIKSVFKAFDSAFKGDWSGFWNAILNILKGFISLFTAAGKAIFTALWDGLKAIWTDITTWTNLINSTTTSILGLTYLNGVFYYGNNSKLYYTTDFVTTYSLTGTISNFLLWNDGVNIYNCNNKIIFGTSSFSLSADTIPLLNITSGNLIQVTNKIIVQRGSNNNLFINLDLENKKLPFFSSVSGGNTTECYYIRALG